MQGSSSIETGCGTLSVLVLLLGDSLLSLEECLSALVELEGGNEAVRGMNGNLALLTYYRGINTEKHTYRWSYL